ncbi:MAG: hypothetical protein NWE94_07240 [Candidatus Bathyarchaeota archaeon]|nr:hypothetical protein [Candidatus Bathyarchaeota archaeon]
MLAGKVDWPLRVGLFLVSVSLFSYMLYELANGVINRGPLTVFWILVTDVPGCIGMASRVGAGFVAVVVMLFYVVGRDLSRVEAFMAVRLIVLFEAGYWFLSFFMSGVMGLAPFFSGSGLLGGSWEMFFENTLPCFVQSVGLVAVLLKLFFVLNPNKPLRGVIKWGLIAGTFYVFVFWLNNTGNWVAALGGKGWEYVTLYPANLFSFLFTVVGLLALGLYAAYFSWRSFGAESLGEVDLHKVGVVVTFVGLYFAVHYFMYIYLGAVGGWGTWYAWMLGHNLDLWAMSLPLVGLPLLFRRNRQL